MCMSLQRSVPGPDNRADIGNAAFLAVGRQGATAVTRGARRGVRLLWFGGQKGPARPPYVALS